MLKSALLVALSLIAGRGAVVVVGVVLSQVLGATAYAAFAFLHVTATSFSNISTVGMQNALPRYFAQLSSATGRDTISQIVVALLFAASGLALAALVLQFLPSAVLGAPLAISNGMLAILLVAIGLNNLLVGASSGLENFGGVARAALAQGAVLLLCAFIAVLYDNLSVVLWGYAIAACISLGILSPSIVGTLWRYIGADRLALNGVCVRQVGTFCGPLFVAGILTNSGLWIAGRSLLVPGVDNRAFAEFALGLQWFGLASLSAGVVGRVVLPRLSRAAMDGNRKSTMETVKQGLLLSILTSTVVVAFIVVFSDYIIAAYGPDFLDVRSTLVIFVSAAIITAPVDVLVSNLVARNRQIVVLLLVAVWWSCLMLMLSYAPGAESEAVALAILVSYVVYLTLLCVVNWRVVYLANRGVEGNV